MARGLDDHPVSHDEADRHAAPRRVPTVVAILAAAAVLAVLAYLRALGLNF